MTGKEFSEVDFDRLADYLGGALDGTPDAGEVERLVTHDARWQAAYAELGAALERVRGDLSAFGMAAGPMPAAVVARLDAALRAEADAPEAASGRDADVGRHAARPPVRHSATAGRGVGVPVASGPARDGVGPPTRRRTSSRRWTRWAGLATAAAAAVAFCGLGINVLGVRVTNDTGGDDVSAANGGTDAQREGQAPAGPGGTAGLPPRTQVSGADYRPETFAVDLRRMVAMPGSQSAKTLDDRTNMGAARVPTAAADRSAVPAELRRLAGPADLSACLTALTGAYPAPASVLLVDYARFDGQPALVVTFTDGTGRGWAVAAGPACGLPSVGADTRFTTRVL